VPARGECLHVHVAGESVLILRQKDESLRAFYNVCSHRGSRLVRTPPLPDPEQPAATRSASLPTGVVCPYHAWTYNLDGSLRAAPYVQFDAACPKEGFSLVPVHLDTWGGFIFVNLATTPAQSLLEQLVVPVRKLARYPLASLRRGAQLIYDVRANWKVILENYNECYHCGPVHPELCALVPAFRERGGASLAWDDGIPHREGAWTFTQSGTSDRAPFPGLSETESRAVSGAFGNRKDSSQGRSGVSEPAAQRRGRTHRRVHALADESGSHTHRLRVPVSSGRNGEGFVRPRRRRRLLGHRQSTGLADLRIGAGRHAVARIPRRFLCADGRSQSRHPPLSRAASRRSVASGMSMRA
jgi:phenylpropionate dioxygenase-like ring-hydroxylating dioxygenase large terminal subunit